MANNPRLGAYKSESDLAEATIRLGPNPSLAQVKQFLYPTEADVIEQVITDQYALYRGDCVQVLRGIPDNSIHCSVSSWPFCSLYSYTDAVEDFSNIRTREDFFKGIDFLLSELHRVMMPGRIVATHCMQIPLTNERD